MTDPTTKAETTTADDWGKAREFARTHEPPMRWPDAMLHDLAEDFRRARKEGVIAGLERALEIVPEEFGDAKATALVRAVRALIDRELQKARA